MRVAGRLLVLLAALASHQARAALPQPGCDQFPTLISMPPPLFSCVQNCCAGQDQCYFISDCLNIDGGTPACMQCDSKVQTCMGLCASGMLDCSRMSCGCSQGRCYDFTCAEGQAGYCAPNCTVPGATPCRPQRPGEVMSAGTARVTNASYQLNMGYQFSPNAAGSAVGLGGLYSGTMIVRLYRDPLNPEAPVIAQATNTSANAFSFTPITPVALTAGAPYGVAVDLFGNAAAITWDIPPNSVYGKTTIICPAYGLSGGPPRNCSGTVYYGMADVEIAY